MDRIEDTADLDVIELGSIGEETKGPVAPLGDVIGLSFTPGLSDD